MEIAPIAGIRVMPVEKIRPVDPELTAFFDIEATAKPGDDTYTGTGRKAAGAEEPDEDCEELEDLPTGEPAATPDAITPSGTINFFA